MFEKLNALAQRMDELEARLAEPGLYDDPDRAAKLLKERNRSSPPSARTKKRSRHRPTRSKCCPIRI